MPEFKSSGIFVEIVNRVLSSLDAPVEVELEHDFFRIGILKHEVVQYGIAEHCSELICMVVVSEPDSLCIAFLTNFVEISAPAADVFDTLISRAIH